MKLSPGTGMRILLSRLGSFFRRRALDRQLEEELRFHLDMEAERNRERGMGAAEAVNAARRAFGGVQQVKEAYRERRGLRSLELRRMMASIRLKIAALAPMPSASVSTATVAKPGFLASTRTP
jgi:putative ABC transport system permease protein